MRPNTAVDASLEGEQEVVELEERAWLPRHARGDPAAFAEFLERYQNDIYSYLARCGLDKENRDDLFQDILMKIHRSAASYQSSRPLRPWVFTLVANTVRNHFRSEGVRRTVWSQAEPGDIADPPQSTERQAAAREIMSWVEQAIPSLPFTQREVLVLTTIDGLQQKDVAEILRIPLSTVKTHLRRARLTLTKKLAEGRAAAATSGSAHDKV